MLPRNEYLTITSACVFLAVSSSIAQTADQRREFNNQMRWNSANQQLQNSYHPATSAPAFRSTSSSSAASSSGYETPSKCNGTCNYNLSGQGIESADWLKRLNIEPEKVVQLDLPFHTDPGSLQNLRGLNHLRALNLQYCAITEISALPLDDLKSLEKINLSNSKISDLTGIEKLTNLRELWLYENDIDDSQLIRVGQLKNLQILELGGNRRITAKGLEHLTGLKNLQDLRLMHLMLVDDSAIPILGQLKSLTYLDIYNTSITYFAPFFGEKRSIMHDQETLPNTDIRFGLYPDKGATRKSQVTN